MRGNMVDIQSATAENRQGKKGETTGKIECPHLLCRAAVMSCTGSEPDWRTHSKQNAFTLLATSKHVIY